MTSSCLFVVVDFVWSLPISLMVILKIVSGRDAWRSKPSRILDGVVVACSWPCVAISCCSDFGLTNQPPDYRWPPQPQLDSRASLRRGRVLFGCVSDNRACEEPFFLEKGGRCPSSLPDQQQVYPAVLDAMRKSGVAKCIALCLAAADALTHSYF